MDQEIIDSLKNGDSSLFKEFYLAELEKFKAWCYREAQMDHDEARDLYQESQMYLYENIVHGKLTKLNSKLSTYLYAIAKNQLHGSMRKASTMQKHEIKLTEHLTFLGGMEDLNLQKQALAHKVSEAMNRLLDPCQSLLRLFYYDNLSFEQIAARMGYKNKDVAKNQKKRCLDKLRTSTQN